MLQFDAQVGVVLAGEVPHVLDGPFADLTPLPCELDDIVQINVTRGSGGEGPPPGEGRPGIRPRETTTDWDMLQTLKWYLHLSDRTLACIGHTVPIIH